MKIISFAWTTPALLAGQKTVTRRDWNDRYAGTFLAGERVAAWDRQPRYGGKQVAVIQLTVAPLKQGTGAASLPKEDWWREGFDYLQKLGAKVDGLEPKALWRAWQLHPRAMWVVRFELVEVFHA